MASKAAEFLATALEQDAEAFEHKTLENLTGRFQAIQQNVVPINDIPRPTFKLAMSFLKEWDMALHRGADYFGPIKSDQWPELARIIADCVREGSMPNNRLILDTFIRKRRAMPWLDINRLFGNSS